MARPDQVDATRPTRPRRPVAPRELAAGSRRRRRASRRAAAARTTCRAGSARSWPRTDRSTARSRRAGPEVPSPGANRSRENTYAVDVFEVGPQEAPSRRRNARSAGRYRRGSARRRGHPPGAPRARAPRSADRAARRCPRLHHRREPFGVVSYRFLVVMAFGRRRVDRRRRARRTGGCGSAS